MSYKKHFFCLVIIIASLIVIYAGSMVVSIDFKAKSETFAWLDSKDAQKITRIVLKTEYEMFELRKRNDLWLIYHNGNEYPARQLRLVDFLDILTTRTQWPVHSSDKLTHERFGLDDNASRVTIYIDDSAVLDLILGKDDATGMDTYFLKAGQDKVHSGDNTIKAYMTNAVSGWYNFRIFPESETGVLDSGFVQRIYVYRGNETQVFTRNNYGWDVSGISVVNPDTNKIEEYIRTIITTEGDGFVSDVSYNDPLFNQNRIEIELGNGRRVIVRISEPNTEGRRYAVVSGRDFIYNLPPWAGARLLRDASSFEMQ